MFEPKTAEVKVVPLDATNEMMDAGVDALHAAEPNIEGLPGHVALRSAYDAMLAASPPAETGDGANILDCATWVPLDDNGHAEVRVNGRRITTMPSYVGAEEVADRINQALVATAEMRAALSAQSVSPSEGEGEPVDWQARVIGQGEWKTIHPAHHQFFKTAAGFEMRPLYTHPASDQSDTERMRAALKRAKAVLENTAVSNALRVVGAHEIIGAALAEKAAGQ